MDRTYKTNGSITAKCPSEMERLLLLSIQELDKKKGEPEKRKGINKQS